MKKIIVCFLVLLMVMSLTACGSSSSGSTVSKKTELAEEAKAEAQKAVEDAKVETDKVAEKKKTEAEKAVEEAKAEAKQAVEEAKAKAEKAVEEAKAEAEKVMEEAKAEAEKAIAEAKENTNNQDSDKKEQKAENTKEPTNTPEPTNTSMPEPEKTTTPIPTATPTDMPEPTEALTPELTETLTPVPEETSELEIDESDQAMEKEANAEVYAYKKSGPNYTIYYIIDIDEGYVYRFIDDGEDSCDRLRIDSGNLNDGLTITYHIDGETYPNSLYFKNQDYLIVRDHNNYEDDFYSTDLEEALKIRDTKRIVDY